MGLLDQREPSEAAVLPAGKTLKGPKQTILVRERVNRNSSVIRGNKAELCVHSGDERVETTSCVSRRDKLDATVTKQGVPANNNNARRINR